MNNEEVYVVSEAFSGRASWNNFCAVFSTEEKALNECKRLAQGVAEQKMKEWGLFCKTRYILSKMDVQIKVEPGENWKGFSVMTYFDSGTRVCDMAYYVHKEILDKKSGLRGIWTMGKWKRENEVV